MHTKYTNGEIWKVAYPILISLIMEQLIGMTDTAFMGRVGEVELGASAIAGVYYLAIFMLGFGFSIGSQILIARRNGEGNIRMSCSPCPGCSLPGYYRIWWPPHAFVRQR